MVPLTSGGGSDWIAQRSDCASKRWRMGRPRPEASSMKRSKNSRAYSYSPASMASRSGSPYPVCRYPALNAFMRNGGYCSTSNPMSRTDAMVVRVPGPLLARAGSSSQNESIRSTGLSSSPSHNICSANRASVGDSSTQPRNFACWIGWTRLPPMPLFTRTAQSSASSFTARRASASLLPVSSLYSISSTSSRPVAQYCWARFTKSFQRSGE